MEFLKIYHGKITEALAMVDKSNIKTDRITGKRHYVDDDITITLPASAEIKVTTHKLLMYAIAAFTSLNSKNAVKNRVISFRLKDFLADCGVNVDKKPSVDKGRAVIKQEIATLKSLRISICEGSGAYSVNKSALKLFMDNSKIKSGNVNMVFTTDFAEYLIKRPIAIYPSSLLKCDGKKQNAYRVGYRIAIHSSNKNNQIKGTASTLRVATILKYVCLPTRNDLKKSRQSWRRKIKAKLDDAFDYLTQIQFLKRWTYGAESFEGYLDYESNKIKFEVFMPEE